MFGFLWDTHEDEGERATLSLPGNGEVGRIVTHRSDEVTDHFDGERAVGKREALALMRLQSEGLQTRWTVLPWADRSRTVDVLVEEFVTAKKAKRFSERYLKDIKLRLRRLLEDFGECIGSPITVAEIEDWLQGLKLSPRSINSHRAVVRTLSATTSGCRRLR